MAVALRQLGAFAGPAQAAPELARRPGDQGRFGGDRIFRPEAAAHILGHQPQLFLRQVQHALAHQAMRDLHALRGEGDGDDVVRRVVGRPCGARLHVVHDLARRADGERRDVRGPGEGRVRGGGIAFAPAAHQVARHVVMEQRRARGQRLRHRNHRRQRLVVDGERLRRVARLVERLGHDHGHDVADMAHLAGRHRQMQRLAVAVAGRVLDLADRRQVTDLVGQKIVGGVDRGHAGRGQRGALVDADQLAHGRAASAGTARRARPQARCRRHSGRGRSGTAGPRGAGSTGRA